MKQELWTDSYTLFSLLAVGVVALPDLLVVLAFIGGAWKVD